MLQMRDLMTPSPMTLEAGATAAQALCLELATGGESGRCPPVFECRQSIDGAPAPHVASVEQFVVLDAGCPAHAGFTSSAV